MFVKQPTDMYSLLGYVCVVTEIEMENLQGWKLHRVADMMGGF